MAKELGHNSVLETVYNINKIKQPGLSAFPVVGRNMANDVHLVLVQFGLEELVGEPLELVGGINGVIEAPRIQAGAVVCVQSDYPESSAHL